MKILSLKYQLQLSVNIMTMIKMSLSRLKCFCYLNCSIEINILAFYCCYTYPGMRLIIFKFYKADMHQKFRQNEEIYTKASFPDVWINIAGRNMYVTTEI